MKCVICGLKITSDINGWDGGHNAEPVKSGQCCDKCNKIVIERRLNDYIQQTANQQTAKKESK